MHKLKNVLHSASRKRDSSGSIDDESDATSPRSARAGRQTNSLDEQRPRQSSDNYRGGAQYNGRSRPLSSAYDPRQPSGPAAKDHGHGQSRSSDPANDSIASNYKAYLPALSTVESADGKQMPSGGDRRLNTGESSGGYEGDVADRNINQRRASVDVSKRKPLPATPSMSIDESNVLPEAVTAITMKNYVNGFAVLGTGNKELPHKGYTGAGSVGSRTGTVPSGAPRKYSVGADSSATSPRKEPAGDRAIRKPRGSVSQDDEPPPPPDHRTLPSRPRTGATEGTTSANGQHEIQREIERLLDGVVDLNNTVDEDKDVTWAPVVTHEVIKPHTHEIIQKKIFREIHNYEYYYHIQPVHDIEVLPPRHWIPNPNGQGLIEISADELPSRTGDNRRWKIVHEHVVPSANSRPKWRTEPEIIQHPTEMTDDGLERKETTILYPPTLADMTEYDGLVQPVHFDHKTGERWLGEITTMHKLRAEMGAVADPGMSMGGLAEALPETPGASELQDPSHSSDVRRKPTHGQVPAQQRDMGRDDGIAMAV